MPCRYNFVTFSCIPCSFLKFQKFRGIGDVAKFFKGFKLSFLKPEAPAIAEFSTGE